jgi:hypothetical protein
MRASTKETTHQPSKETKGQNNSGRKEGRPPGQKLQKEPNSLLNINKTIWKLRILKFLNTDNKGYLINLVNF